MPASLRDAINEELSIVDDLPNYQLLAVAVGKPNPNAADNSFALSKVRRCDTLMAQHADDIALCAAYAAKRAKEQAAADRLFEASAMDRARTLIERSLRELHERLRRRGGPFLFGSSITMADLFWGVELIRIDDLGMSHTWANGKLPALDTYYQRTSQLPAVLAAVTEWPSARLKLATPQ